MSLSFRLASGRMATGSKSSSYPRIVFDIRFNCEDFWTSFYEVKTTLQHSLAHDHLQPHDGCRVNVVGVQTGYSRMVWKVWLPLSTRWLQWLTWCHWYGISCLLVLHYQVCRVCRHNFLRVKEEKYSHHNSSRNSPWNHADVRLVGS